MALLLFVTFLPYIVFIGFKNGSLEKATTYHVDDKS